LAYCPKKRIRDMLTNITNIYAEIIFTKQRNATTATLLAKGMFRLS